MKNLFKRFWHLAVFIMILLLGSLPLTPRVGAIEWAAAPVGVRFEGYDSYDSCLRALLVSCRRALVNWYAVIHITATDGNQFEVPAVVRNVSTKQHINPADWQTHDMILFYDRLQCPECMKFDLYRSGGDTSATNKVPAKIASYNIDLYVPRPKFNDEIVFYTLSNLGAQPFDYDYYPNYCSFWLSRINWCGGESPKVASLEPSVEEFERLCKAHKGVAGKVR